MRGVYSTVGMLCAVYGATRENAACRHFQPSYNVLSYVIRVCSWFDCPRTSTAPSPSQCHCSAHPIHGRNGYPLYRSPQAVPAHIHYTASRTVRTHCTTALTPVTNRRRTPRGRRTMRRSKICTAQPKRMQTFEESGSPESLGTLPWLFSLPSRRS